MTHTDTADWKKWRIVFMGTPEFAVASLARLLEAGAQVVAVVTAPDKPGGRGMQLQSSPVKQFAAEHRIPVLQPEKLKDPAFLETLRGYQADVQVVVAFRMLPELVWNMPPQGTINVHGSLLPHYRGAAPINWAIINGEKETGVTTFKLQQEIDTGGLLMQERIPIPPTMTAGELHDVMMETGARLLVRTLEAYASGTIHPIDQEKIIQEKGLAAIQHAPKIFTETCRIQWNQPAVSIFNLIRGLSPYPAAFTELQGKKMKIFRAAIMEDDMEAVPGQLATDHKTYLQFACADGWISVLELQLEGKKRMPIADFLRGFRFEA
jgi:methionyl-tRNA formyltransferase